MRANWEAGNAVTTLTQSLKTCVNDMPLVCNILERLILSLRDDIYLHQNIIISKTNYGMGLKFHPARGIIREKAFLVEYRTSSG